MVEMSEYEQFVRIVVDMSQTVDATKELAESVLETPEGARYPSAERRAALNNYKEVFLYAAEECDKLCNEYAAAREAPGADVREVADRYVSAIILQLEYFELLTSFGGFVDPDFFQRAEQLCDRVGKVRMFLQGYLEGEL